jgi:hypothetical protein
MSSAKFLLKKSKEYFKLCSYAYPNTIKLYHGTDGKNLKSIFQNGLLAKAPRDNIAGVYLTPDFSLAARYAINRHSNLHDFPAILEIQLSGKKRIKKILRDSLDREEGAYDMEGSYESESIRLLERDLKDVFGIQYFDTQKVIDTWVSDLTELKGINLYKSVINYAQVNGLDKNNIKKRLFSIIPPGTSYDDLIEISDDGTIVLTESYYNSMHQGIYPRIIPPSAIKKVWVKDIPPIAASIATNKSLKNVGLKLLPHEYKNILDEALRLCADSVSELEKIESKDELGEKTKEIIESFSEEIEEISKISKKNDAQALIDLLFGIQDDLNDSYYDQKSMHGGNFYELTKEEAIKIADWIS